MKKTLAFLSLVLMPIVAMGDFPSSFLPYLEAATAYDFATKILDGGNSSQNWNFNMDRCAENGMYKNEYTIDRRCYLTDEQRQMFPYNTVVEIKNTCGDCMGVIVKDKYDGNLYIFCWTLC